MSQKNDSTENQTTENQKSQTTEDAKSTSTPSDSQTETHSSEDNQQQTPGSESALEGAFEEDKPSESALDDAFKEDDKLPEYEIPYDKEKIPFEEDYFKDLVTKAKKFGMSEENAKKFIEETASVHSSGYNKAVEEIKAKVQSDRDNILSSELYNTPEKKKENFAKVREVVDKFGDDGLKKFLKTSASNNVSLHKLLLKIHELSSEEDDPTKGKGEGADSKPMTLGQKWYPHFYK